MTSLDDLATTYDPKSVEPKIHTLWKEGNFFHANPADDKKDAYTIVIPPPNVTGALHGGHALNNTLQDILIRWHRMRGDNTLWMPGTDHAGIATQAVVERTIFEKEKKSRHDLGREKLVERIWEWKEQYGNRILEQLRLMGCSCDWERTRFTLDDMCARAVRHTFFKLFRDGLIVRGKRLVNWDTQLQTAVADDEVYHETVKGHFYHFKYKVNDPKPGEPEFVHIATTRPETMLGDTAVAVHPDPEKALNKVEADLKAQLAQASEKEKDAIQAQIDDIAERRRTVLPTLLKLRNMARDGRKVNLPLVDREIPLICDEWAKPELGSGCVKITPAHDANDYEVGQRAKLPMVNVLTPDGKVAKIIEPDGSENVNSSKYAGLKFATAGRKKVVADLEALGLVEKIEDRLIEVGHSDRSKTPIEPYLSDQWFVRMGDLPADEAAKVEGLRGSAGLAQLAMDMVADEPLPTAEQRKASGKVHFFPPRYRKTYLDWLSEKRDWCISRQLWWGHRIPVFKGTFSGFGAHSSTAAIRQRRAELLGKLEEALGELGQAGDCEGDYCVRLIENMQREFFICARSEKACQHLRDVQDSLYLACHVEQGELATSKPRKISSPDPRYPAFLKLSDLLRDQNNLEEDPDVLDTWFSSALWPHSTMGWPDDTPEMQRYYPGSVLSTAREIITLWVARMVLTGMYNVGKVPFHDVYIHAVIQDGQGRPFKKTLGNGFDPVDIIEAYGADALRYTMASITTETQDIRMPMKHVKLDDGRELETSERFELGRNFCNKVWNAARFAFMNLEGSEKGSGTFCAKHPDGPFRQNVPDPFSDLAKHPEGPEGGRDSFVQSTLKGRSGKRVPSPSLPIEDRWILSRVSGAAAEVQDALAKFQFSRAVTAARDFFWDSLCDWYLELVKSRVKENRQAAEARQVLAFALDQSLRLLHPFIPFITERLWQQLNELAPQRGLPGIADLDTDKPLIVSSYPPVTGWHGLDDPTVESTFTDLQTATRTVREIRQSQNVPPKQSVNVAVRVPTDRVASLEHEAHVIKHLANVGELTIGAEVAKPKNAATLVIGDMQIYVANVIDPAAERKRLEKERVNLDKQIKSLTAKLGNENFTGRAPAEVVDRERQRLAELKAKHATVVKTIEELG